MVFLVDHQADLLERVQGALAAALSDGDVLAAKSYEVWLFGSRARGDWDGRSDTDLLVVADDQTVADGLADALLDGAMNAKPAISPPRLLKRPS
jgi:predicted nucleotidyltransferase